MITIHPLASPRYYGFYLDGFRAVFGDRILLTTKGFPRLSDPKDGLAVILPQGEKIYIGASDHPRVDPRAFEWADVVGQVNVSDGEGRRKEKVVPIGPSFGTPCRSKGALVSHILQAGVRASPAQILARLRDYLRHQAGRAPLSSYRPGESTSDEIFFIASYWPNAPEANHRRLRFLRAAQHVGIAVNGGFWAGHPLPEEFRPFQLQRRFSHAEYLARTKSSFAVFNTPAVHGCLGWKLAEFLALGKAIISTPLGRVMPGDFRNEEHMHIVDDSEDLIAEGLARLRSDHTYRSNLEASARRYWQDQLAPERVVRRLLAAVGLDHTRTDEQAEPRGG